MIRMHPLFNTDTLSKLRKDVERDKLGPTDHSALWFPYADAAWEGMKDAIPHPDLRHTMQLELNNAKTHGHLSYGWLFIFSLKLTIAVTSRKAFAPGMKGQYSAANVSAYRILEKYDVNKNIEKLYWLIDEGLCRYIKKILLVIENPEIFPKVLILPHFGELTMAELNQMLADGVWQLGLVNKITWADNIDFTPLAFFIHDIVHFYTVMLEERIPKYSSVPKDHDFINAFVYAKMLYAEIERSPDAIRDTLNTMMFFYSHEMDTNILSNLNATTDCSPYNDNGAHANSEVRAYMLDIVMSGDTNDQFFNITKLDRLRAAFHNLLMSTPRSEYHIFMDKLRAATTIFDRYVVDRVKQQPPLASSGVTASSVLLFSNPKSIFKRQSPEEVTTQYDNPSNSPFEHKSLRST